MIVEFKTCTRCNVSKPVTQFNRDRTRGPEGRRCDCKMCEKKYKSQLLPYIRNKYHRMKSKYKKDEHERHKIDITQEDFIREVLDQLTLHHFRCPMTGELLKHQQGMLDEISTKQNNQSLSVDRIDPSKGYHKENMMVCSWEWNKKKKDMTLEEMIRFTLLIEVLKPDIYRQARKKAHDFIHEMADKATKYLEGEENNEME